MSLLTSATSGYLIAPMPPWSTGVLRQARWTWALSIVGLVIVFRILLIPLFVRQIKSQ